MGNSGLWRIFGGLFSIFIYSNALLADVKDDIDVSNVCASIKYDRTNRYDGICDHLGNLVENPYSSPDYLFYQLEQLSLYVKQHSGKQFQLKVLYSTLTTFTSLTQEVT